MKASDLFVFTARFNPIRWQQPHRHFCDWCEHMLDSGVNVVVIECTYGEREMVCEMPHVRHIGIRADSWAWCKENLINIGIQRTPEAKYICWSDSDVFHRRSSWAAETVEALQHYRWVQPWSDAYDLGPHDEHLNHFKSFCHQYLHGAPLVPDRHGWRHGHHRHHHHHHHHHDCPPCPPCPPDPYGDEDSHQRALVSAEHSEHSLESDSLVYPHPGYCHASTRRVLEYSGGLFELAGMGAGDHMMALGLLGRATSAAPRNSNAAFIKHLVNWQNRITPAINGRIGFVHGTIEHRFHGRKEDRGYLSRWQMFLRHDFDPDTDLKRNTFGALEWAGNKPELEREWDLYVRSRAEDANWL